MIKQIHFQDTYSVRNLVLRPGKNIETCFFKDDELQTTRHFGYFIENNLVGIVSIYKNNSEFQIRGMAILLAYQKLGIGKLLIKESEKYIKENKGTLIWFNARLSAIGFYEKMNYSEIGIVFNIENIGEHIKMQKHFVVK